MKKYEIRIGTAEGESVAPYQDRSYARLSDAVAQLRGLLELLESDKDLVDDDLSFWIVRSNTKKGAADAETELVQLVCGMDEDSDEFCYEGIYYLSRCSDFERMILVGEKKGAWIGNYSVQIASDSVNEVCFFSDLEMILESIKDLREDPEKIRNRLMTIFRRTSAREADPIAVMLYTLNRDGSLRMQSRLEIESDDKDAKALLAFIHDEQNEEHEEHEEASAASSEESEAAPAQESAEEDPAEEDIEAVETAVSEQAS